MPDVEFFEAGNMDLQSGGKLQNVRLAYTTHGRLNEARDNVILFPTFYMGDHTNNEWLIGTEMALSPDRYFIVVPNMLGNGISSSPSNTSSPADGPRFPLVTHYDNVRLQHRLLVERFAATRLQLVVGWSMGAQQAYHWGSLYPDMVARIAPFCGSARTSRHNFVFLEGLKATLTASADFLDGSYSEPAIKGMRAFARVYSGWCWSQAFFREKLDMHALGTASLEEFLRGVMEANMSAHDANDALAMLSTWQHNDISDNPVFEGSFEKALRAIRAKAFVMPCHTDLYFPPEDNEHEVRWMPNAELRVIPSIWGHMAGSGISPDGTQFINSALLELLDS